MCVGGVCVWEQQWARESGRRRGGAGPKINPLRRLPAKRKEGVASHLPLTKH